MAKRRAEFELLRILAMLGVVVNHVFNYGLLIYDGFTVDTVTPAGFSLWTVLELMKLAVLPSVNCFVLITGYFLIDKVQLRLRGIWKVWSITWFYAVGIYLLAVAFGLVPFQMKTLLEHATPVLSNTYWFVTSYLALLLLAPLLAWALRGMSRRQYQVVLAVGFVVCFQPLLGQLLMDRQQILLFAYLFAVGGYIRRFHDPGASPRAPWAFLVLLLSMYAYVLLKNMRLGGADYQVFAMAYHGLVLPQSVALFLTVKGWHVRRRGFQRAILAVAPLSFSVYIVHTHPLVHQWLWTSVAPLLRHVSPCALPVAILAVALAVFAAGIAADSVRVAALRCRQWLFKYFRHFSLFLGN